MIEFIKAKHGDEKALAILKQKCWATTYAGIYDDAMIFNFDYKLHEEKFNQILNDSNQNLYIAFINKIPIGYFNYGTNIKKYKNFKYYIKQLYLLSEARGHGIGGKIFNYIRKNLKDLGETQFFCNCNFYNTKAINFYEKMGGVTTQVDLQGEDKSAHQAYIEFEV